MRVLSPSGNGVIGARRQRERELVKYSEGVASSVKYPLEWIHHPSRLRGIPFQSAAYVAVTCGAWNQARA
jgi:hypothetical protein